MTAAVYPFAEEGGGGIFVVGDGDGGAAKEETTYRDQEEGEVAGHRRIC